MAITDWPSAERPREKLLARGVHALSDAELLALLLRVGCRGQSAVDLARALLTQFGSLTRLCNANAKEFSAVPGMGLAKYAQLQAVMELARRALNERVSERTVFDSPEIVRHWLQLHLGHLLHETFWVVLLDTHHKLIDFTSLFRGTLTQACVYPREIVKLVLDHNAAAVIFAHNHPSGSTSPSQADKTLTQILKKALALIDVNVLDHFIVPNQGQPFSFAENGLLD